MLQSILDAQKTSVPGCQIAVNGATERVCRRAVKCIGVASEGHWGNYPARVQDCRTPKTE